jgi:predicted nucleotide-binding protein
MAIDDLRAFLTRRRTQFEEKSIAYGTQFRCASGEIFNLFDSGRLSIQGKRTGLSEEVNELWSGRVTDSTESAPSSVVTDRTSADAGKPVFIVYGHDTAARDGLELILRRMQVDPIVLQNVPAAGDTIIEKLEHYLGSHRGVGFAAILLTPDDEGYLAGQPEEKRYRARQNVILELGMVLGQLGRSRVAILHKESVELPSDIAGLIYIPFKERVDEIKAQLYRELRQAGYDPKADGL